MGRPKDRRSRLPGISRDAGLNGRSGRGGRTARNGGDALEARFFPLSVADLVRQRARMRNLFKLRASDAPNLDRDLRRSLEFKIQSDAMVATSSIASRIKILGGFMSTSR
jgi:hypothetical protein